MNLSRSIQIWIVLLHFHPDLVSSGPAPNRSGEHRLVISRCSAPITPKVYTKRETDFGSVCVIFNFAQSRYVKIWLRTGQIRSAHQNWRKTGQIWVKAGVSTRLIGCFLGGLKHAETAAKQACYRMPNYFDNKLQRDQRCQGTQSHGIVT